MSEQPVDEAAPEPVRRAIDLLRRLHAERPDWTHPTPSDPGITLLQLLVYAIEELGLREPLGEPRRRLLLAAVDRLSRLLDAGAGIGVTVDGEAWRQVPDVIHAAPDDRVFSVELDAAGGAIVRFGDGRTGRRPTDGSHVTVDYRSGSGAPSFSVRARWPVEPPAAVEAEWAHTIRIRRGDRPSGG